MIRRRFTQRPDHFTVDPTVGLARGLVFAGLGGGHGSVVMRDSSPGKKNDGTLINMTPADDWGWSEVLGRRVLGGYSSTAYATFDSAQVINLPNQPAFSVSFWAYREGRIDISNMAAIVWGGTDDLLMYPMELETQARTFWRDCGSNVFQLSTVARGAWYHHVQTFTNGSQQYYLNGSLAATATKSLAGVGPFNSFRLGNWADGTGQNFLGGLLSDVLLHDRILTPAEISALADPSNVMLSGLILPPRRRVWPSAVVPLALPDYPDVSNESPFENAESIVTVAATGGSAPVSYSLTAQSTTVGMLKVTGALTPDATGIYTENGTYNGEPAYERADGAYWVWFEGVDSWYITTAKGYYDDGGWGNNSTNLLDSYYDPFYDATGTATVANYAPFAIDSATGEITITDATGLAVGQVWTLTVRATDALSDTAEGTVTVELVAGAAFKPAWAARCNNLIGAGI